VPEARCAPEQVERVLLNLLTNALRHTPSDGTVAVTLAPAHDHIRVTVEDTGDGLTPEATRRMFDRFWRDDSDRQANGAGLGLAIARGLVEAQGGTIWRRAAHGRRGESSPSLFRSPVIESLDVKLSGPRHGGSSRSDDGCSTSGYRSKELGRAKARSGLRVEG
jgi:light-regulated signal transduction histidine kinase (bacteriophytochrome)